MKRIESFLLLLLLLLSLCGCEATMKGEAALIEKAREVIPISEAESIELRYAGACEEDERALLWFISGNEYQAHYYLPMECEVAGEGEYRFLRTCKPMDRGMDIAVLQWQGGYAFLVNNSDCTTIRLTDSTGSHDIAVDRLPFLMYRNLIPSEYVFLDANGNEIP